MVQKLAGLCLPVQRSFVLKLVIWKKRVRNDEFSPGVNYTLTRRYLYLSDIVVPVKFIFVELIILYVRYYILLIGIF